MENVLLWLKTYTSRDVQNKNSFYMISIENLAIDIRNSFNNDQIKKLINELQNKLEK